MRMPVEAARQRFRAARVARLATVDGSALPHLVPVTFAVIDPAVSDPAVFDPTARDPAVSDPAVFDPAVSAAAHGGELIVFAVDHKPKSTTALRRLANIEANPLVTFLVDHYTEDWNQLWWVRADAVATAIDGDVRLRAIAALRTKYFQYLAVPPDGVVIGARVTGWVGWQAARTVRPGR